MRLSTATLLFLIFFVLPAPIQANDAAFFGDGADIYPIESEDIQLLKESIIITDTCGYSISGAGGRFLVHVDMTFKNFGPDQTVQMGFPFETTEPHNPGFRTWVDGKEATMVVKNGVSNPLDGNGESLADFFSSEPYPKVYTYPVHFKKGQTKKIFHIYNAGGYFSADFAWEFTYILRTGALWKDSIKDLKINLFSQPKGRCLPDCISPKEHQATQNEDYIKLSWHFQNYEPKQDLKISQRLHDACGSFLYGQKDPVANLMNSSWDSFKGINDCEFRVLRNLIFAANGYPFKNPYLKAFFYNTDYSFSENPFFSVDKMPQKHREFLNTLDRLERQSRGKFK